MKRYFAITVAVLVFALALGGQALGYHEGATGKINVNTAAKDELAWFLWRSGIGNAANVADNIIAYRKANGPFRDIEELRKVKGISSYRFNQISLWVKVEGETDYKPGKAESPSGYPYPEVPFPRDGPSKGNFPEDEQYGPWSPRP